MKCALRGFLFFTRNSEKMAAMEIKVTAAGFLLISFLSFGFSQEVPDEVVYTEVQKTLVLGATGVLRCRFKGAPNAVYWKKGKDLESAQSLLTWIYGEKFGSCYEDEICDIDGNYSLVIKSVTSGDSGRYICRVSNYNGFLIYNHTDVTITNTAVRTKSVVVAQKGRSAFLPCKIYIRPNKVAWVRSNNETLAFMDLSQRVLARGGAGYEEGIFNMTNEYSLVIYDVVFNQEDNYTCEVTDYDTGHIFQDSTMLAVFATPREPFPSIAECPKEQQDSSSCTLSIDSPMTLTCQVDGYYPLIDLFFLHGMEKVEALGTGKWNNSDGTISKRITIEVDGPSNTPYECVAAGVIVQGDRRSMAIHLIPDKGIRELSAPLAVVFPVIVLAAIIIIAAIAFKRMKRRSASKYKGVAMTDLLSKGCISNFELWILVKTVEKAHGSNTSTTLNKIISVLNKDDVDCEESSAYLRLCRWKQRRADHIDQKKALYYACDQVGLSQLKKNWRAQLAATVVTESDIEHILWQIREPNDIKRFLSALEIDPTPIFGNDKENGIHEVIGQAKDLLLSWAYEDKFNNALVIFSLTLESLNLPNDFFELSSTEKECLNPHEISEFIGSLHHNHIHKFLADSSLGLEGKRDPKTISDENRSSLFDAYKMVFEILEERNDSNYGKRNLLKTIAAGKNEAQSDATRVPNSKWPSDDEIKELASVIKPSMMPKICHKLDIGYPEHDANNEEKKVEALSQWRDKVDGRPLSEKYQKLSAALKDGNIEGLLPRLRNDFVQLSELVDLAFYFIMQDTIPFAEIFGYNLTTLAFSRIPFLPEYFRKGTISLVIKFFQTYGKTRIEWRKKSRSELFEILEKSGFQQVFHRGLLAYDMSYGELCGISKAMSNEDEEKGGDKKTEATRESDINSNNDVKLDMQYVEMGRHETELKGVLAITDEDIVGSGVALDHLGEIDLFRIWKEKPRLESFNYRMVLVKGLRKVDRSQLCDDVIKGKYCTSGETSIQFINNMVCGMNKEKLDTLGKILRLKDPMKNTTSTCKKICDWVQKWTKSSTNDEWGDELKWKTMKEHADFNDELVRAGFLDLAREIMTIEQNLKY